MSNNRPDDAYFHVSVLPQHKPFLLFAFMGQALWHKVLSFGQSLSPHVFTKVTEAGPVLLREVGILIFNYRDDWLFLTHSRDVFCAYRDLVLKHLSQLRFWVNWEKSELYLVKSIPLLGIELDSESVLNSFRRKTMFPLKQLKLSRLGS